MNNQTKTFVLKDGDLYVTIKQDDKIMLPVDGQNVVIGHYEQITNQKITKPNVQKLLKFVEIEKEKADKQMTILEEQWEKVKDVEQLQEDVVSECAKYIGKKKEFRKKIIALDTYLQKLASKKQIKQQIDFIKPQIDKGNIELNDLKSALE